jgi:hypothetical protein
MPPINSRLPPRPRCTQPKLFWAGCKHHWIDLSIRACDLYRISGNCLCQYNPDAVSDDLSYEGRNGHTEKDDRGVEVDRCEWCRMDPKTRKVRDEPGKEVKKNEVMGEDSEVVREEVERGLRRVDVKR